MTVELFLQWNIALTSTFNNKYKLYKIRRLVTSACWKKRKFIFKLLLSSLRVSDILKKGESRWEKIIIIFCIIGINQRNREFNNHWKCIQISVKITKTDIFWEFQLLIWVQYKKNYTCSYCAVFTGLHQIQKSINIKENRCKTSSNSLYTNWNK